MTDKLNKIPYWASRDLEALILHHNSKEDLGVEDVSEYVNEIFHLVSSDQERSVVVAKDEADNIYIIHGGMPAVIEVYVDVHGNQRYVRTYNDFDGKPIYHPIS